MRQLLSSGADAHELRVLEGLRDDLARVSSETWGVGSGLGLGATTTAAVAAFQKDKGLTEDGVAGPTTLAAINTALAAG